MNDGPLRASVALRMVFEGAPPGFELLALATRRSERGLRAQARREGWRVPKGEAQRAKVEQRLMNISDRLVDDLEAANVEGRESGRYDKARIDALAAMLRLVEKIGDTTRGPDRAHDEQIRSDAEMAAALERIDARIRALAEELAEELAKGLVGELGGTEPVEKAGGGA